MNSAMDYEQIAHLYDSYLQFSEDIPFFVEESQKTEGLVLELACGTGRISLPLIEVGANLTCVDSSPAMLAILRQKLADRDLFAWVVEADIAHLDLDPIYNLVLLPFQSFHELQDENQRRQAIAGIARSLVPKGRFICTLHNPQIRLQGIDRVTDYGPFSHLDSGESVRLSIALDTHDPQTGRVSGVQTIYEFDDRDRLIAEFRLPIQFFLLELATFQEYLHGVGLAIEEVFGNYDRSPFNPQTSPYIIVCARKN
ncbi:MAG: class I SAM-dependent methyltransferase [Spirulina sp.]